MENEPQHMLNHMLNFWGKSEPHMLIDIMLIKKKTCIIQGLMAYILYDFDIISFI